MNQLSSSEKTKSNLENIFSTSTVYISAGENSSGRKFVLHNYVYGNYICLHKESVSFKSCAIIFGKLGRGRVYVCLCACLCFHVSQNKVLIFWNRKPISNIGKLQNSRI